MFTKTTQLACLGLTALFLSLSPSVLAQSEDFSLSRFSEYEHKIPTVDLSKSAGTEDVLDQAFDDAFAGSTVKGMTAALVTSEGTIWEIEDLLSLFMLEPNFDVDQDWGYSNSEMLPKIRAGI